MKYIFILGLFIIGVAGAAEPALPAAMSALPPAVRSALQDICHGCTFADAGAPWSPSDVVAKDFPPHRRIVSIEHMAAEWRVQYEHGGRGAFARYHLLCQPIASRCRNQYVYSIREVP